MLDRVGTHHFVNPSEPYAAEVAALFIRTEVTMDGDAMVFHTSLLLYQPNSRHENTAMYLTPTDIILLSNRAVVRKVLHGSEFLKTPRAMSFF